MAIQMRTNSYRKTVFQVLMDWQSRRLTKFRTTPPANFTASTLDHIRKSACLAVGASKCEYWASSPLLDDPSANDEEWSPCFPCLPQKVPTKCNLAIHDHHSCDYCPSPAVSVGIMEQMLFESDHDGRYWRRHVNACQPMTRDLFIRAVIRAWLNDWVSPVQLVSILQQTMALGAASTVLREILKKYRKPSVSNEVVNQDSWACEISYEEEKLWQEFFEISAGRIERNRAISESDKQQLLADLTTQNLPQICSTEHAKIC